MTCTLCLCYHRYIYLITTDFSIVHFLLNRRIYDTCFFAIAITSLLHQLSYFPYYPRPMHSEFYSMTEGFFKMKQNLSELIDK